MLEEMGISIYFNEYGFDIAEDLPAITAKIRTPLEDETCTTVADIGGNDSGARIMNQFRKYFLAKETERYLVVNANRFETDTLEGALFHLRSIEEETGLSITGIVNNTHMLTETTTDDILKGYELCQKLSRSTGIPIVFSTCAKHLEDELKAQTKDDPDVRIFPMTLQMRPSWLDVPVG